MRQEKHSMNGTALMLPGIGDSGPDHWQSLWQRANPSFMRIQQQDWDNPLCKEWVETLENTLSQLGSGAVLVAHSLGCALVSHWAQNTKQKVRGALLVAPPNPEGPAFPKQAIGFSPLPLNTFPFPSIVVASTNDPYGNIEFAKSVATAWGSRFVSIGAAGHINAQSGLGEWNEGFSLFKELAA